MPQQTTVTKQPNRFLRWWMRHYRHIGLASMAGSAILICIIAVMLLPIIIRHYSAGLYKSFFKKNQGAFYYSR